MRLIQQIDKDGYKHLYYIKDNDPDTAKGISADPPDIESLDWKAIKKEIHNGLVDNRLIQLSNIRRSDSGLNGIILRAFQRRILDLYRSIEDE